MHENDQRSQILSPFLDRLPKKRSLCGGEELQDLGCIPVSVTEQKQENKKLSLKVKFNQYTCSPHQDIRKEMEIALLSKTTIKTLHKKIHSSCLE